VVKILTLNIVSKKENFPDWTAVRTHTPSCSKNTKEYTICAYYGPLKFTDLAKYKSIDHLRIDYPNLTFDSHHFTYLEKAGKLTLKRLIWTKEEVIESIKRFYEKNGKIPEYNNFENTNLEYPSNSAVTRYFGTWNKAIEAAGFTANYNDGMGQRAIAKDGILYRSLAEVHFVNNFLFEKEEYEYEKPYGNGWFSDFYLPKHSLYVEIDGGLRPYRIEEKIQFCKDNNLKLKVVKTTEVYKTDFSLLP